VLDLPGREDRGFVLIGAHYDAVPRSPGADDNGSALAVLLELASAFSVVPARRPIRLAAFDLEETNRSGSRAYAQDLRRRGEPLALMISLEMLGYRDARPGSQRYPAGGLRYVYPDRGDFIAFVGDLGARSLVRRAIESFRKNAQFPSEGVAAPAFVPGVTWSDHWSFRDHGFPAIMVTDTAFFRYPHYHLPSDTPEKLDYERMARVTLGLAAMLKELAHEGR